MGARAVTGFWQAAAELSQRQRSFVAVTLVAARGHAPQDPGAKALVTAEGLHWGTVGGGKVEARAIAQAQEMLAPGAMSEPGAPRLAEPRLAEPRLHTWNLQRDIGMTCGGEVTFLFEGHHAVGWNIVVFGAGHVGQALTRALLPLPCRVTVIDHRAEWVERLPVASNVERHHLVDVVSGVAQFPKNTFFICMTQGHGTDVPVLEALFRHHPDAPYVGVIGSPVKAIKIRAELKARGVSEGYLARLRCPVGLPLGGNHPAEIAISVAAELLQVRGKGAHRPEKEEA